MSDEFGFYHSICHIFCGEECGNGYLVAPDLVLTADHVVGPFFENGTKVDVCFDCESPVTCEVLSTQDSPSMPLTILRLTSARDCGTFYVGDGSLPPKASASICGFPSFNSITADKVDLEYVKPIDPPMNDCNASFKPLEERRESFKGFSGSPVFVNGLVVGIALEEYASNGIANRVWCLCGLEYRNKLMAAGVNFHVRKTLPELAITQVQDTTLTNQAISQDITSEIDTLVDELFRPIKEAHLSGKAEKGNRELQIFLERLPSLHCSNAKKADCYYQGAVQLLLNHQPDDAECALHAAKAANPGLDDSVYRAYTFLQHDLPEQAKECLKPVDSSMKLDAYFSCLIFEKADLSEFKTVLQATGMLPNWQSLRLLAVAALRSGLFEEGHRYVQEAKATGHVDPHLPIVEALIFYWKALYRIYPNVDRAGFAIANNLHFVPDREQTANLEQAYQILDGLYERVVPLGDTETRSLLAWALLAVSSALPGKDCSHWLKEFRELRPLDPVDILFCVNNRVEIPDDVRDGFLALPIPEQDGGCHAYARYCLLVSLEQFDKARETFSAHLSKIALYYGCPADVCRLQMLIDTKDYQEASALLKKVQLSYEEKQRYEIAIQFRIAPKAINRLVKQTVDFALATRESVDFKNALTICRFYKKWDKIVSITKEWWDVTGELIALEAQIEALLMKYKYDKCLRIIRKAENAGDVTVELKQYKITALLGLAKTADARAIAQELGDAGANPRIAVLEAQTFISEGQPQLAVDALRSYADRGLYDIEVYGLLTELLKGSQPDQAFRYAELIYRHAPEDEQVLRLAGNIALMTGHDESESVAKYILQLQKNNGKDGAAWTITINEAVEMIRKAHEHQTFLENAYKNREIPIHLFATPGKNALGGIIYSILGSGMPYLGRFGVSKDIEVDFECPLVLDYTACLILYRLGLLETVCSWFSNVWVDQHLLEIWLSDIDRLKSGQLSVAQKAIKLSDTIKSLQYLSHTSEEHILRAGFDHVLLRCAEDTDAILVAERSRNELFNEPLPDGWDKSRIHPHALYAALDRMKLPHPTYDYTASLEESIAKVTPQCKLVLDRAVIDELQSTGILEDVFNLFHVVLPMELVSRIHNEANEYRNRDKAAKWLEEAYNVAGKLLLRGRITRKPSKMPKEPDANIYCQLFTDEFSLISNTKSTLVIDDCLGTSYRQIDVRQGNSPIISSYDLITSAYQNGKIDDNKYYQLIDQLLSIGYGFFIPSSDYVLSRLQLSAVDDQGFLDENVMLRNLRRMLAYAFNEDIGPRSRPMGAYTRPELAGFLCELTKLFNDCLVGVWRSERPLEWCTAASDWLLAFTGDFLCDIKRFNTNAEDSLAMIQARLLFIKIVCSDSNRTLEIANWLNPYLIASWWANPSFAQKAAVEINEFIRTTFSKNLYASDDKKSSAERIAIAYIYNLPYLIRPAVLKELTDQPYCDRFAEIVQEDEQAISELGDIQQCIEGTPVLDKAGILCGDAEAMNAATCFILSDIQSNSEAFIQEFPIESMYKVPQQANYALARFFTDLAWYFPPSKRAHLHELKRALSLLPD